MVCLKANEVQCVGFSGLGGHLPHPSSASTGRPPCTHSAACHVPACPHLSFSQAVYVHQGHSLFPLAHPASVSVVSDSAWKWIAFLWQELHQGGEKGRAHCRTKIHEV